MRVLLVEPSPPLASALADALRRRGQAIDVVATGDDADSALRTAAYDLVILDRDLPDQDGLEVLRELRRRGGRAPVLVLSARDRTPERVAALDLGADDYLGKPFDLAELAARAGALIRRGVSAGSATLTLGRVRLDTARKVARVGDDGLELGRREYCLLEALLLEAGRVVRKETLHGRIYDGESDAGVNALEIQVHRLRKKMEPTGLRIRTVRGLGYMLECG